MLLSILSPIQAPTCVDLEENESAACLDIITTAYLDILADLKDDEENEAAAYLDILTAAYRGVLKACRLEFGYFLNVVLPHDFLGI